MGTLVASDDVLAGPLSVSGTLSGLSNAITNDSGTNAFVAGVRTGAEVAAGPLIPLNTPFNHPIGTLDPTTIIGTYGVLTITYTGQFQYTIKPNFAGTLALSGDAFEVFTYQAQDGTGGSDTAEIRIGVHGDAIVPPRNHAPVIGSGGGKSAISIALPEKHLKVTTIAATDPDGNQVLRYSVSGGADAALFKIDAATGALGFRHAPDFGSPQDQGHDNVYDVVVRVSDGSLADTQSIAVHLKKTGVLIDLHGQYFGVVSPGAHHVSNRSTGSSDTIKGGACWDWLDGGGGDDKIAGNLGNDVLVGGNGRDTLSGGRGRDMFVFNTAFESNNVDHVTDFRSGTDKIVLSHHLVGDGLFGLVWPGEFYAHDGARSGHDANDRIIYDSSTGVLSYDCDGNGSKPALEIAVLDGHSAVRACDILIV